MTAEAKRCGGCDTTRPASDFSKNRSKKDGLSSQCKACIAKANREYRKANRERIAKAKRAYRQANAEKVAKAKRAWHEANREAVAEAKRAYYEANREAIAERQRAYDKANAERRRESLAASRGLYRRRFRRIHGTEPEVVEMFTMADVIERYGAKCFHCADGDFEELDHYPASVKDGGPHSLENVKPSCSACNRQTWREEMGDAA